MVTAETLKALLTIQVVRVKDHTACLVEEARLVVVDGARFGVEVVPRNTVEVEEYLEACTVEAADLVA